MPYFGACFSPYFVGSPYRPPMDVPEDIVDMGLSIMAQQRFTHIRTYSCLGGDRFNVKLAQKHGLKVGLGIWVVPGKTADNQAAIVEGWNQVSQYPGVVVDLVIGNEVNREDNFKFGPGEIKTLIDFAKGKRVSGTNVKVTSCFSGTVLHDNPEWGIAVDACESVVYLTVYPWYGGAAPNNIQSQMDWSWSNGLQQVAARGKTIVIAEIGWPSAGGRLTTPENEKTNFDTTKAFLLGETSPHFALDAYWFEMFDEWWKTDEGPQGPHWGLSTGGPAPDPKWTPAPTGR